jgi:hypothetical protein
MGFLDLTPKVPFFLSMMEKPRGKTTTTTTKQGSTSSPIVERRSSREMAMKNRFGV